ncbi:MAG: hypothetical protein EOO75_18515, partial [Myxococcales bacterium]
MSVETEPAGLHVQLVPHVNSLRLALWLERYRYRSAYLEPGGPRSGVLGHPGCVAEPPRWLPPGSRPAAFLARLPRMGNGHPVALPGVIGSWSEGKVQWQARKSELATYEVRGWVLPIDRSLGPLRTFLRAYREAHGEGLVSPAVGPLLALLDELQRRLDEGPLLPMSWTPGLPAVTPGGQLTMAGVPPAPAAPRPS